MTAVILFLFVWFSDGSTEGRWKLSSDMDACLAELAPAQAEQRGRDGVVANGDFYAIVTGDYTAAAPTYDDGGKVIPPDGRQSVYRGMRIRVPQEKLNHAQQDGGNPSGHGVIFLDWAGAVLCYFGGTLF